MQRLPAKPQHRGFETQARARARLEKERDQNFAARGLAVVIAMLHFLRMFEQGLNFLPR